MTNRLPYKQPQVRPFIAGYSGPDICGEPFIENSQTSYVFLQFLMHRHQEIRHLLSFDEAAVFEVPLETHVASQVDPYDRCKNREELHH
jgi:hypothetical protein